MKSFCNPINLSYKYQHYKGRKGYAFREAADPTLVEYKGTYYLFASMSGGFWYSSDLIQWEFHENRELYIYDYAPDVRQVGEYLYFSASRFNKNCPFVRTKDPLSDVFEVISEEISFYDPNVFCDDDGKVYFYWGCNKLDSEKFSKKNSHFKQFMVSLSCLRNKEIKSLEQLFRK